MESAGFALMLLAPIVGIFAATGLVVFVVLSVITGKPGAVLKNGLTIAIIVGLSLLGLCAISSISTTINSQEVSCAELHVEDHYKLIVSKLMNGRETGIFGKLNGSEQYQRGITSYAIERHYLLGQAQLVQVSDPAQEFFWVDLLTGEVRRFPKYDQYLQSLQDLGFAKEPTLIPIKDTCTTGKCQSCSSPRFQE